jgi:hypothetical protein
MKIYKLLSLALLMLTAFTFNGCGGDESAPDIAVVVDRADGTLFQVNLKTGALTELGQIKLGSTGLNDIRGLAYNKGNKKFYATSTNDGLGKLYSINSKTLAATEINANADDHWYGLPDIKVTSDNKLITSTYHKTAGPVGYGPGLLKFNQDGTVAETILFTTTDPNGINMCCGFGLTIGETNSELLISSSDDGIEIFSSDLSGEITLVSTPSLEGFDANMDVYDFAIKNIIKKSGKYYALVQNWTDESTVLAELDLDNDKLIQIAVLSLDDMQYYHGLALVPGSIF